MNGLKLPKTKLETLKAWGTIALPIVAVLVPLVGFAYSNHLKLLTIVQKVDSLPEVFTARSDHDALVKEIAVGREARLELTRSNAEAHTAIQSQLTKAHERAGDMANTLSAVKTATDLLMRAHQIGPVSRAGPNTPTYAESSQ
jgi:hypothetical protein